MNPTTKAKALKEARAYIPNILRVSLNDCSDSGEEADKHQARFNGIVDDEISIGAFIAENLLDEWREQALKAIKEDEEYSGPLGDDWYWPVEEPSKPLNDIKLLTEPVKPAKRVETSKQADSLSRAQQVIDYLGDRKGFDGWYHDIDPDTKNEILEGLALLLDGRSVDRKTFVITGTLSQPRAEVQARIESAGGYVSSALSSKTDYLIVGEDAGSKLEKARKMGTKILSEKELGGLIG